MLCIFYSQKQLARMVRIYEKRIDWLSVGSRRIWGTICERRYCYFGSTSVLNGRWTKIDHYGTVLKIHVWQDSPFKTFIDLSASFNWLVSCLFLYSRVIQYSHNTIYKEKIIYALNRAFSNYQRIVACLSCGSGSKLFVPLWSNSLYIPGGVGVTVVAPTCLLDILQTGQSHLG